MSFRHDTSNRNGNGCGRNYGHSYGNSYGNSYGDDYENSYGNSYRDKIGNSYGNFESVRGDHDDSRAGLIDERYGSQTDFAPSSHSLANRTLPSRSRQRESNAEKQISQVLEHIRQEWPSLCDMTCVPVQLALQLLDSSSVGRAHDYRQFRDTHAYLQESLKNIVHEHHQGFNSSIGTFHKIQGSLQTSQKRVRALKESLAESRENLCVTDPQLKKLSQSSQSYDELLHTLHELDDLRTVPDQLEARISEKRFLSAIEVLHGALRKLRHPEMDEIRALNDLRGYLAGQETTLVDILVEELHEHLFLKSPYCQERWHSLAKYQGTFADEFGGKRSISPFFSVLESLNLDAAIVEDPMKNPEADTFYYIGLLIEALNKLGRLQTAVETLKQRLPVELFDIVNDTIFDVDQRHPASLRGGRGHKGEVLPYSGGDTQLKADVIYDLLWTLYGKFEAIGECHRVFHEYIKALIRRQGAGNNSALLGSFKELWHLYQNEIRSLLHNYVTTDADIYQFDSPQPGNSARSHKDANRERLFSFSEADAKSAEMKSQYEALEGIIQATVPGLAGDARIGGNEARKARSAAYGGRGGSRRNAGLESRLGKQATGSYKALVEPSVFNMRLLLPPTLIFLQRLRCIVPPGSDLATSTLTTFLDNFLVNVFQPQLDETLEKLSEAVLTEVDSFLPDPNWHQVAARPLLKGTMAFYRVVTIFCRMLGTLPPDQSLSGLIVHQMKRYHDRCSSWYQSLVTNTQERAEAGSRSLRACARFVLKDGGAVREPLSKLWSSPSAEDKQLVRTVVELMMSPQTSEFELGMDDVIQDRDTIGSLCMLYTSLRWLGAKIRGLRHLTGPETDPSRHGLPQQMSRRWTLLNDPSKATRENGPVRLPLTQDTVGTLDEVVASYEELAFTALATVHAEARCRILRSLGEALSGSASYLLDQDVREPDARILQLNSELVQLDESIASHLGGKEVGFVRKGLGVLINRFLIGQADKASPMNGKGCERMQLNILVLQQNLKNVEEGMDLGRVADYFSLFEAGPEAVVERVRQERERSGGGPGSGAEGFSDSELQTMLELCFSEALKNTEQGISTAARRKLDEKLAELKVACAEPARGDTTR